MGPLVFLLVVLVLSVAGSLVLWLRHREPVRYDSGIRDFQREMQALAPPDATPPPAVRPRPRPDQGPDRRPRQR